MVAISTVDIGLEAEILREEMDMRLLDIEDWDERPETTDAGEIDRGVEISELEVLLLVKGYDAMACASESSGSGEVVGRAREKKGGEK